MVHHSAPRRVATAIRQVAAACAEVPVGGASRESAVPLLAVSEEVARAA
jgi:hypothetical protein